MQKRLASQDLELVTMAVITARQTGGELPAALDRLSGVIRERLRIQQKVKALTSMGRLQVIIISIMPFALLAGLLMVMPQAADIFFGTLFGWIGLGIVVVLVICGALLASKITRIDI
jgi:tight adherence protein B